MKMIKSSVVMYNIPDATDHDAVLMHLERIGRTCYKSEDKITTDSAAKFLKNIRNRKHWAILEHYIFTVSVPEWIYFDLQDVFTESNFNEDSEYITKFSFIHRTYWDKANKNRYRYLVSFSATALNYLVESITNKNDISCNVTNSIITLYKFMRKEYPELMSNCYTDLPDSDDSEISFLTREEIKSLPNWIRDIHDFMSVLFIVDRGVSHEIVRHRPASYAQESTRYCNYSKDKFDNGITVIIPCFFDTGMGEISNSLVFDEWKFACESAERRYLQLLEYGAKAEQARTVLPNSLKTELNMTATIHEFKHFFNMRCDIAAHPQMREVACQLLIEANDSEYYKNVFNDQIHLSHKEDLE